MVPATKQICLVDAVIDLNKNIMEMINTKFYEQNVNFRKIPVEVTVMTRSRGFWGGGGAGGCRKGEK